MSGADPAVCATHRCGTGEGSRSTHGSASVSTQLYEMPAGSAAEEDSDEELADTQGAQLDSPSTLIPPKLVGGMYVVGSKIGKGSFGEVFYCKDSTTGEDYAVKFEPVNNKYQLLAYEAKVLKYIQNREGFPRVFFSGREGHHHALVIDLLGPSLADLFAMRGTFERKTVLMMAIQMLDRLKCLHTKHMIHRDIKPENFTAGKGRKANTIYMIDFGLSKKFRDPKTDQHIAYREGKGMVGTVRWASLNAHLGMEQSRRDDLESLGYVLIHYLKNEPLDYKSKSARSKRIMRKKKSVPIEEVCRGLPDCIHQYMKYCRGLMFEARPDYSYLKDLFLEEMERECAEGIMVNDGIFEWTSLVNCDGQPGDPMICPIASQMQAGNMSAGKFNEDPAKENCSWRALASVREEAEDTHPEPGCAIASNQPNTAKAKPGGRKQGCSSSFLKIFSFGRFSRKKPEDGMQ